jgi:hypothetical protein
MRRAIVVRVTIALAINQLAEHPMNDLRKSRRIVLYILPSWLQPLE